MVRRHTMLSSHLSREWCAMEPSDTIPSPVGRVPDVFWQMMATLISPEPPTAPIVGLPLIRMHGSDGDPAFLPYASAHLFTPGVSPFSHPPLPIARQAYRDASQQVAASPQPTPLEGPRASTTVHTSGTLTRYPRTFPLRAAAEAPALPAGLPRQRRPLQKRVLHPPPRLAWRPSSTRQR